MIRAYRDSGDLGQKACPGQTAGPILESMGRGIDTSVKRTEAPLIILDQQRVLIGDLTVNLAERSMSGRSGRAINLSSFEFRVLATLIKSTNEYVPRAELLAALVGDDDGHDELVDIYVGYLRHKLVETTSAVTIDRGDNHDFKLTP